MLPKGLVSIITVRKQSVEAAQRALANGILAEMEAAQDLIAAERVIVMEQIAASEIDASDEVVEAFAIWLTVARRRVEVARHKSALAEAEAGRLRALLAASRVALETAETLAKEREMTRAALLARRDSLDLEVSYRPPGPGDALH